MDSVPGGGGQVDVLFPVGAFAGNDSASVMADVLADEVSLGMWSGAFASCSTGLLG